MNLDLAAGEVLAKVVRAQRETSAGPHLPHRDAEAGEPVGEPFQDFHVLEVDEAPFPF